MEKTLARAIYKLMEPQKEYATSDLVRLIGDDYFKYVPVENHPFQENGYPVREGIKREMWKVVKTGYARTFLREDSFGIVKGRKFGSKPAGQVNYTERVWVRIK